MQIQDFRRECVQQIVKSRPVYGKFFTFLLRFIEAREQAAVAFALLDMGLADETLGKALEEGVPILNRENIPLDDEKICVFMGAMLDTLEARRPEETRKIRTVLSERNIGPSTWVRATFTGIDNVKHISIQWTCGSYTPRLIWK